MKKSVAKKWIKALRSGKYKQGTGCLRGEGKFCCLGVLCDISKLHKWIKEVYRPGVRIYSGTSAALPPTVLKWASMKSNPIGVLDKNNGKRVGQNLAALNDSGKTFNEIAEIIEKNVDTL